MASDRTILSLLLVLLVAACGVDGPPLPPEPEEQPPTRGIAIRGQAEVGIVGRS